MNELPTSILFLILFFLILTSAFFSGSETGLMSLNRYRLKHLAKTKKGGAYHAFNLLKTPDQLISLILLGNNFINILITQLATYIGFRLHGDVGIAIATGVLTLVLLIFAEVTPKTIASEHPEKIAYPAAYIYRFLIKFLYPIVFVINWLASHIVSLFRTDRNISSDALNSDELRIAVKEASSLIPQSHSDMLIGILDLEKITVDDIMVPRHEINGVDLNEDWDDNLKHITQLPYTRIPVFKGSIDEVSGTAMMRKILPRIMNNDFNPEVLQSLLRPPYFIPEGTALTTQLINFKKNKRRIGFVVDEYGDIQGLVTLEDILEEIVGEFTTDPSTFNKDYYINGKNEHIIDGSVQIRRINKQLHIHLPTNGPKTLNGLIQETLQDIPHAGTSVKINGYPLEILLVKNNIAKTIRLDLNMPNTSIKKPPE
ncbi:MAG: HlyC/CorC family transporter [Gammaproteobacteria bacterium]|nr:HlyC/CorC family transporter [Gammaproteobacteria bacterium]